MSVPVTALILIFLLAAFSSFAQRVTGFGFGIIMMTVLPYVAPSYGEATAISGLLAIFNTVIPAFKYRKLVFQKSDGRIPGRKLLVILATFLVVSFFSVRLLSRVDGPLLKHILGGVLILLSLWFLFVSGRIHISPTVPAQVGMGGISGVMGGLFAMQGPPAVIYFLACSDSKEEYLGLTQWYFLIGNLAMTAYRGVHGLVTREVLILFAIALPAVLLGVAIGDKVFDRLDADRLRKIIYIFLALAGLAALLS